MKTLQLALIALLAFPPAALSQQTGEELAQITFASVDGDQNGMLTVSEIEDMAQTVAISMDSDGDTLIRQSEFMDWDFGFHYLAEQEGGTERYTSVKLVMFALQDLDGDGTIDPTERRINTAWSFQRADLNGDRVLSEQEYLAGWMPILIMRAGRN